MTYIVKSQKLCTTVQSWNEKVHHDRDMELLVLKGHIWAELT
jgi:hypothetical protein